MPPYPGSSCIVLAGCVNGAVPQDRDLPPGFLHNPGLVWLSRADMRTSPDSVSYLGVFPGGYLLFAAIMTITDGDGDRATLPVPWQLITLVAATVLAVAALTAVPARLGSRRPRPGN